MSKHARKLSEAEKAEHKLYQRKVNERSPKSNTLTQCLIAFIVGGAICFLGQLIGDVGESLIGLDEAERGSFTAIVLIFAASLLTGIGVYDKIGAFAGAGSVVPITGFANSVVAPAMEHRREGLVMGIGAQIFSFAGPVLVYGITASVIIGIITWLARII